MGFDDSKYTPTWLWKLDPKIQDWQRKQWAGGMSRNYDRHWRTWMRLSYSEIWCPCGQRVWPHSGAIHSCWGVGHWRCCWKEIWTSFLSLLSSKNTKSVCKALKNTIGIPYDMRSTLLHGSELLMRHLYSRWEHLVLFSIFCYYYDALPAGMGVYWAMKQSGWMCNEQMVCLSIVLPKQVASPTEFKLQLKGSVQASSMWLFRSDFQKMSKRNVPVSFFFTSGEARLQTHSWKFTPPPLISLQ